MDAKDAAEVENLLRDLREGNLRRRGQDLEGKGYALDMEDDDMFGFQSAGHLSEYRRLYGLGHDYGGAYDERLDQLGKLEDIWLPVHANTYIQPKIQRQQHLLNSFVIHKYKMTKRIWYFSRTMKIPLIKAPKIRSKRLALVQVVLRHYHRLVYHLVYSR
jgi:hypothetical protein